MSCYYNEFSNINLNWKKYNYYAFSMWSNDDLLIMQRLIYPDYLYNLKAFSFPDR